MPEITMPENESLETIAKRNGFDGQAELIKLVADFPLTSPSRIRAFDNWKRKDGTKKGLLALYERKD